MDHSARNVTDLITRMPRDSNCRQCQPNSLQRRGIDDKVVDTIQPLGIHYFTIGPYLLGRETTSIITI